LKDVKTLLGVKEATEGVVKNTDTIQLSIDALDESLQLFQKNRLAKDSQGKVYANISKKWIETQKMAKDVKKEIEKDVGQEKDKNNRNIANLEEDIKGYEGELKKKEFFRYNQGVEIA
jgi:gas vesicle protein